MNCTLLQGWLLPAHLFVQLLLLPSLLEGPHLYLAVPNLHLFACCLSYLLSKNFFFLTNLRFCTLCLLVALCLMLLLHVNESCCCHKLWQLQFAYNLLLTFQMRLCSTACIGWSRLISLGKVWWVSESFIWLDHFLRFYPGWPLCVSGAPWDSENCHDIFTNWQ